MKNFKIALAAAGLAVASSGVNAAIVSVSGATVNFSYDDSFLSPLFGAVSVSGDTLQFDPTAFSAFQNGGGLSLPSHATTPLVTVTAKSGYALTELSLFEQGDYYRIQENSNATFVSVGGQFIVNNNPNTITTTQPLNVAISTSGLMDGTETFQTTNWTAENSVYLNSTESATAKIQNILLAGADNGLNQAFIEKKLINLSAATTVVPVPGAFWLFGSALTGVLVSRRRNIAV